MATIIRPGFINLSAAILAVVAILWLGRTPTHSVGNIDPAGTKVGVTYYGGHFDDSLGSWVIDNANQCSRIDGGEFTAESLGAIKDTVCDDDSGFGYLNDTPLHNRVGYAELSLDASAEDFSALGNLPSGTKLEINYRGKCLIAEKLDVGTGGYAVNGYHRALDLWWQTARSIGFTNGFDVMTVKPAPTGSTLTPLGQTTTCSVSTPKPAPVPASTPKATAPKTPAAETLDETGEVYHSEMLSTSIFGTLPIDVDGVTSGLQSTEYADISTGAQEFTSAVTSIMIISLLITLGVSVILWRLF